MFAPGDRRRRFRGRGPAEGDHVAAGVPVRDPRHQAEGHPGGPHGVAAAVLPDAHQQHHAGGEPLQYVSQRRGESARKKDSDFDPKIINMWPFAM